MQPEKGPGADPNSLLIRRGRRHPVLCGAAACAAAGILAAVATPARAADVTSTWKDLFTGSWSNPARWSNSPAASAYPNNGNLGNTYDAVINGAAITLDVPVALRGLTIAGGADVVVASSGTAPASTIDVTGDATFVLGKL